MTSFNDEIKEYNCSYNFDNLLYSYEGYLKGSLKLLYKKRNLKLFKEWIILPDIFTHKIIRGNYFEMPYMVMIDEGCGEWGKTDIYFPKTARISVGFKIKTKRALNNDNLRFC